MNGENMLAGFYKAQDPSSLAFRCGQGLNPAYAGPKTAYNSYKIAEDLVRAFSAGSRFSRTIMPIIRPWPLAMTPQIQKEIEAISNSPCLKPWERQAVESVAIALWKASGERKLKDGRTPEVIHAFGVARRVEELRTKENMRAKYGFGFEVTLAAILHDAVEDGLMSLGAVKELVKEATASRRLAHQVARWVGTMSHASDIGIEDYAVHVEKVMADPHTRLIKACDMLDRHTRLQVDGLFESEQDKTLIQLSLLYQKYDPRLGAVVEKSARRAGLLPSE